MRKILFSAKAYAFTKDTIVSPFIHFPPNPESYEYTGNPKTVSGFLGMGTQFSGNNQKIKLGDYANRCLGNSIESHLTSMNLLRKKLNIANFRIILFLAKMCFIYRWFRI